MCFTIQKYGPNPEKPGYLKFLGNESYGAIKQAVAQFCKERKFPHEWISTPTEFKGNDADAIPPFQFLFCAAYEGVSEGCKIEVVTVQQGGIHHTILTIKTFEPLRDCFLFAYELDRFLTP